MFNFNTPIWFYPKAIDFRRQIDGLVMFVADHLEINPTQGQLFVFRNQSANKIKLLWYDHNGFWLCYKKLEKGKLKFPSITDNVMELTKTQLSWLLSGLDIIKLRELPAVTATEFF
jgi:transposase